MRPLALALALASCPLAVRAQPAPSDPVEEHLHRGVELRRSGQDEAAFSEFEAAYQGRNEPRTAAQLALVCQATGRWLRAEALLRAALASPDDPWIARHREPLAAALSVAERHLATVEVLGETPGATVRINGEDVGVLPLSGPTRVVAGSVAIEVLADGYEPAVRRFITSPGEFLRERVTLVRAIRPEEPPRRAPAPSLVPPTVMVTPRLALTPLAPRAPSERTAWRALSFLTLSVAGALVAGGVASLVVREVAARDFNADCDPTDATGACGALRDRATTATALAWTLLPLGAALVGVGAWCFTLGSSAAPRGTTLACTPGLTGARCEVRF